MNADPLNLPLGPVMCDVAAHSLSEAECQRLRHPLVGGVILFARNYRDPAQLRELCAAIHALRSPSLLIAVDHEGGRVQRFREGFTRLPPMQTLGRLYQADAALGLAAAHEAGVLLAAELRAHGIDLSFTPVLDLDHGRSAVIGDRAFGGDANLVTALATALVAGLAAAGLGAVGKHFPGHGWAEADSHVAMPIDSRSFDAIWASDMLPYRAPLGPQLAAVMPAHVVYPQLDAQPAGFSPFWLQEVLRTRLGFKGLVFSDDLTMEGATLAGDIVARASAAAEAGCDMVLVCNRPDMADDLLARWQMPIKANLGQRLAALLPRTPALSAERIARAQTSLQQALGDLA